MTIAAANPRKIVMQAKGLVKRYGQVTALDGVDFELREGEILAVIGDNGAGKSSLIKALSGAIVPDEGQILLDGEPVHFRNPLEARPAGWCCCRWPKPATSAAPSRRGSSPACCCPSSRSSPLR